jgi:hypothetical protein
MVVKSHCGVSCLSLINQTPSVVIQRSNIYLAYSVNCFIRGIESVRADFGHISTERSGHCEVSANYFHHATAYGDGGQGYGVNLQLNANDYLVINNNFDHLRHSMLLQSGANGNVFRNNYSTDPYYAQFPSNFAGDIVLHGNYPYANLFEQNVANNLYVDASHGKNGPYNVFLRNRVKLYGIIMSSNPATDSVAFIGNEITSNQQFQGNYTLVGNGNFLYGNNQNGAVSPSGTNQVNLVSLFSPEITLADIGFPNSFNTNQIWTVTARSAGYFTSCTGQVEGIPTTLTPETEMKIMFTNPVTDLLMIKDQRGISSLKIFNAVGQLVKTELIQNTSTEFNINVSCLESGIYFSELSNGQEVKRIKFLKN